jgi:GrpB-like predicted nucleotidyltransferase (UPF0157 family)
MAQKGRSGLAALHEVDDKDEPIVVVDYDPAWPAMFGRERGRIAAALGDLVAAIEHVGSTAVPRLGAKPVIDIMVGLRRLADGERCVRPLQRLGYEYKGEFGIRDRLYFRRFGEGGRSHQIHMVVHGSDFWQRHLLFRDHLRDHPQEAGDYYELKVRLAAEFQMDREGYTGAKTEFIESALAKARAAKTE